MTAAEDQGRGSLSVEHDYRELSICKIPEKREKSRPELTGRDGKSSEDEDE